MEIKITTDDNFKKIWNQFVTENSSPSSFLQACEWGGFRQEKLGVKIKRLAVYENDELIAVAQFAKEPLPLKKFYWNCPRGPVIKQQATSDKYQEILKLITNEIKKTAAEEKIIFARMEIPYFCHPRANEDPKIDLKNKELISDRVGNDKKIKPQILVHTINPADTLILDLTKSEEEILSGMHQKTRYNIRLAEKKGIKTRITNNQETITKQKIDIFYKILQETAKRDQIKIFSKSYYENLINYFSSLLITYYHHTSDLPQGDSLHVTLFFAEHNNKILAAIMVVGWGNTATYLHGGSLNEGRELMPNHALQWAAIKWAKEQGYQWYDFWGIASEKTKSNWLGITRFKQGFVGEKTGQEINYLGAQDYLIDKKWYNLYRLAKIFKP